MDKTVKALVNMKPIPGEGIPMFESAAKSLSILACRPNTATEMECEKVREQAEKDTKKTRSLGEASQLELGDIRASANNYYDLKLNISMFAGLLASIHNDKCSFFINGSTLMISKKLPCHSSLHPCWTISSQVFSFRIQSYGRRFQWRGSHMSRK